MRTERDVARRLLLLQSHSRFEPLPGFVHQGNHGGGNIANMRGQGGDIRSECAQNATSRDVCCCSNPTLDLNHCRASSTREIMAVGTSQICAARVVISS